MKRLGLLLGVALLVLAGCGFGAGKKTGGSVSVTVRAYDDQGKGVPAAGVAVHLGTAGAVTGADGVALVPVAEPGTLELVADKDGMVRSFPREVRAQ